jgi:hypothetical protein
MRICLFVRQDEAMLNNRIFSNTILYGMKTDTYMYTRLKEELNANQCEIATQDIIRPEDAELIICVNETGFFTSYKRPGNQKIYLILSEPPVYNKADWQKERHQLFDKVFTYNKDLVDNKKYFLYNFPIDIPDPLPRLHVTEKDFRSRKLMSLMASAFTIEPDADGNGSLLHDRYQAIKWFARNKPADFDFFSRSSPQNNTKYFKGASLLNRMLPKLSKKISEHIFNKNLKPVYRGSAPAPDKIKLLSSYKFYLCYENTGNIPGLISEKLFDCFFAGCVPVYLGAPDLAEYVPKSCYIEKDKFKSYDELYRYLSTMSFETFSKYIDEINNFMHSERISIFHVDTFSKNIIKQIKNDFTI